MAVGIAQVAPPFTDLAQLVTSDAETMPAYGTQPQPAPRHIPTPYGRGLCGDHSWVGRRGQADNCPILELGTARLPTLNAPDGSLVTVPLPVPTLDTVSVHGPGRG